MNVFYRHHSHKHQELDPLIRSVSRVTTALPNTSSVFQLFYFLVVCSDMISKGFGLVALFASVKASSVCIYVSYLVCIQSVVHDVRTRLFCGHEGCSLPLYYIILYYIILYYIILYYIILYYIILYYIILWYHRCVCGPSLTETSLCGARLYSPFFSLCPSCMYQTAPV